MVGRFLLQMERMAKRQLSGDIGFGKTYLAHTIGNHIVAENPSIRVLYMTSEAFRNFFVHANKQNTLTEFTQMLRRIDGLIVDDSWFFWRQGRIPRAVLPSLQRSAPTGQTDYSWRLSQPGRNHRDRGAGTLQNPMGSFGRCSAARP